MVFTPAHANRFVAAGHCEPRFFLLATDVHAACIQISAMSHTEMRGQHFYPQEWGDVGKFGDHVAFVKFSVRGLGLLASALGHAVAAQACHALCVQLSTGDWHARALISWMELATNNEHPDAARSRDEHKLPAEYHDYGVATGVCADVNDAAQFEERMRARVRGKRPPRNSPNIWAAVIYKDLYPREGLRAHMTLPEMTQDDTSVMEKYLTPQVRAEMQRRNGSIFYLLRRHDQGDVIAVPALPVGVVLEA